MINIPITDDSCTYIRHSFAQPEYRVLSELAFGKLKGCFQTPSMTKDPDADIDCPDVAPLTFSNNQVNREAMTNSSILVHPDSTSLVKYCLGTGLQMRGKGKSSHRLKTCEYHDASKSRQGKFLKTMTQEAMQVGLAKNYFTFLLRRVCAAAATVYAAAAWVYAAATWLYAAQPYPHVKSNFSANWPPIFPKYDTSNLCNGIVCIVSEGCCYSMHCFHHPAKSILFFYFNQVHLILCTSISRLLARLSFSIPRISFIFHVPGPINMVHRTRI